MPKVSIIIRCLNEGKFIGRLFEGILHQTHKDVEVIVVDSGSTDNTLVIAEKYANKIIHIKPEEFSFGFALNKGCEAATGDFLLLASAHVYPVFDTWIKNMLSHFEDLNVALVYGKQIGNELTKYSEHRIFAKWFPNNSDLNQTHPFCNNASCMVRKECWDEHKYDESLTGLEDMDWAKKIMTKNYKVVYDSTAPIVHVHEETYKRVLNRYKREAIAHKHIFPDQNFSFIDFIKLTTTNIVSDYYHSLHDKKFFQNIVDIPLFRIMQFYGTYTGYRYSGNVSWRLKRRFYYPNKLNRENKIESRNNHSKKIQYQ